MGTKSRAFMGLHKYVAENKTADQLLSVVFYGGIGGVILSCLPARKCEDPVYDALRSAIDRAFDPQHPDYSAFDHAFDTKRPDFAALRSEYDALRSEYVALRAALHADYAALRAGHALDSKRLAEYTAFLRSRLDPKLVHNPKLADNQLEPPPKN